MRKAILLFLALTLCLSASAEVYSGTTDAQYISLVTAETSGMLECMNAAIGDSVSSGDLLACISPKKVFAAENGTVAAVHAEIGDSINGTVLEIMPEERYTVYCTAEQAYEDPETMLVHIGETLYVKCTSDGTHRAVGYVTSIDGNTYMFKTTGGELYVGETVYLYRDSDCSSKQKVGKGTAVITDTVPYTIQGKLLTMRVREGDTVEHGGLLFTYTDNEDNTVLSEGDGVVIEVLAEQGQQVQNGQALFGIMPVDALCIRFQVPETELEQITVGSCVTFTLPYDEDSDTHSGTIRSISAMSENGNCTVTVSPDESGLPVGLSAEVRIPE